MKNKFIFLIILLVSFLFIPFKIQAKENVNIYLFHLDTCPHCKEEKAFLNELTEKYDNIKIYQYEVSDTNNNLLLDKVKKLFNNNRPYVPFTVIGNMSFEGYNSDIGLKIENAIKYYSEEQHQDVVGDLINGIITENDQIKIDSLDSKTFKIPFIGEIKASEVSLPVLAIIIGTIDGFNPCAMWVLLFLLSMLIGMKNKKRMWSLGLTFILTSGLIYLLIMLAWLKVSISIISIGYIKIIIGIIALIGAFINLKSYYKTKNKENGCTVVEDTKRKKIINKIKKIVASKSFVLALLGIIALAISVNVIEFACSAGLPLLFTQILSMNSMGKIEYLLYILIYIFFFLIDDIIVFIIAMATFELTGVSTKYSKYSHLIGGIIMALIGLLLIFKPEWLSFNF